MQLIDTLRSGGAEKMAVNYFLTLQGLGFSSYLVVSRKEGLLADQIKKNSNYSFLKKTNALDISAFYKLKKYIAENKIDIIQAHGSSWFWAVLCKISGSKIKVIWHDHYGDSENLQHRNFELLKFYSKNFDGIISVNNKLKNWAKLNLKFKKPLVYLPNFVNHATNKTEKLLGSNKLKLICVANLRPQKDHLNLIKAFEIIQNKYDVSLHLIGKNFEDNYYIHIKKLIDQNPAIFYYGEVNNVMGFLSNADYGILSSISEGMPLALLEYGVCGLPVICTNVGECIKVIGNDGLLVEPNNVGELSKAMDFYLSNPEKAKRDSLNFQLRIERDYAKTAVLSEYQKFITRI